MGLDPTQREMARRLIATGGLNEEQKKYAEWFIHSDEMTDSLWASEGGTSLQSQYYQNAQHNWSKLVDWGFVPAEYKRWGDNPDYGMWMTNKAIELDANYFKKIANAGGKRYFLEINIKSDEMVKERGVADSMGDSGFGHAEFGLIAVADGVVSHERAGLGPYGVSNWGVFPGGTQRGWIYPSNSKFDARSVIEVSEERFKAASAYLAMQQALSHSGKVQWGQGSRVCTEFALDCMAAGGLGDIKKLVYDLRRERDPALRASGGKVVEAQIIMPSEILNTLQKSNVGVSRRVADESYRR